LLCSERVQLLCQGNGFINFWDGLPYNHFICFTPSGPNHSYTINAKELNSKRFQVRWPSFWLFSPFLWVSKFWF